jgi:hypothetical protein
MDLNQWRDFLKKSELRFSQLREDKVEKKRFPAFRLAYDLMVDPKTERPPTQEEFVNGYIEQNKLNIEEDEMPGLVARLCRVYPSFIREDYFYALLREHRKEWLILRSHALDLGQGIDFVIVTPDNIGLLIDMASPTARSRKFKSLKRGNLKKYHIIYMHKFSEQIGRFYVPNKKELEFLDDTIAKIKADISAKAKPNS